MRGVRLGCRTETFAVLSQCSKFGVDTEKYSTGMLAHFLFCGFTGIFDWLSRANQVEKSDSFMWLGPQFKEGICECSQYPHTALPLTSVRACVPSAFFLSATS